MKKLVRRYLNKLLGIKEPPKRDLFWPQVIKSACDADRAQTRAELRNKIIINPGRTLSIYNAKGECITWQG